MNAAYLMNYSYCLRPAAVGGDTGLFDETMGHLQSILLGELCSQQCLYAVVAGYHMTMLMSCVSCGVYFRGEFLRAAGGILREALPMFRRLGREQIHLHRHLQTIRGSLCMLRLNSHALCLVMFVLQTE